MTDVSHLLKSDYLNGEEVGTTPRIFTIKGTEESTAESLSGGDGKSKSDAAVRLGFAR